MGKEQQFTPLDHESASFHDLTGFTTHITPTWCPGCGSFGIWTALRRAFAELKLAPHDIAMTFDIGCSSNGVNWYNAYSFHGLHGRALPVAYAAKLVNHKLTVLAVAGDGGAYGEGLNHFIAACRGNPDVTYVVHNNKLYSLTTGQASPTSDIGMKTRSTPKGLLEKDFNPLQAAISSGATFVSRGFADDITGLAKLLKKAIKHKGFSLVDILQPCPSLNRVNTREWYKGRFYDLAKSSHNPQNKKAALIKAGEWGKKIPLGIFYEEQRLAYEEQLPQLKQKPLVKQQPEKSVDISGLLEKFM